MRHYLLATLLLLASPGLAVAQRDTVITWTDATTDAPGILYLVSQSADSTREFSFGIRCFGNQLQAYLYAIHNIFDFDEDRDVAVTVWAGAFRTSQWWHVADGGGDGAWLADAGEMARAWQETGQIAFRTNLHHQAQVTEVVRLMSPPGLARVLQACVPGTAL